MGIWPVKSHFNPTPEPHRSQPASGFGKMLDTWFVLLWLYTIISQPWKMFKIVISMMLRPGISPSCFGIQTSNQYLGKVSVSMKMMRTQITVQKYFCYSPLVPVYFLAVEGLVKNYCLVKVYAVSFISKVQNFGGPKTRRSNASEKVLWRQGNLREDITDVGVVGAAEWRRSITAILQTAFTLSFTVPWNTHREGLIKPTAPVMLVHKSRQVNINALLLN